MLTHPCIIAITISSGTVLDCYAPTNRNKVQHCLYSRRHSEKIAVKKSTCYKIDWHTQGKLAMRHAEVYDTDSHKRLVEEKHDSAFTWIPTKDGNVYLLFWDILDPVGSRIDYTFKTCQ